jgi:hypothetical protein
MNLFVLEKELIDPKLWRGLYFKMPQKCKEIVDGPVECIGIGRNKELGWFIMGSGQGPCLLWTEKDE